MRVRTGQAGTLRAYVWDGEKTVGSLDAIGARSGRATLEVPVARDEGATMWIAVSLENGRGSAAGAVPLS